MISPASAAGQDFVRRVRVFRIHCIALTAAGLWLIQIALFWPGIVEPDALSVYTQAMTGAFDDWHPPILGRLWQVFIAVGLEGTAPFYVIQTSLFWLGLGSIAAGLDKIGHFGSAVCVLIIGCLPHVLGWNTLVLKDTQMTCCLIAAAGLHGYPRLVGRPVGIARIVAIIVLLAYAILVRHNAVFAVAPMVASFAFSPGRGLRQYRSYGAIAAALALFAMMGPINRDVFQSKHEYAENMLKLYDIAGTAHYARLPAIYGISPADWQKAEARACYSPALWDSYGNPENEGGCPWVYEALATRPLTRPWIETIVTHFPSYVHHRLAHFNATLRFWTSRYNWDASSPRESDNPNPYHIGQGNHAVYAWLTDTEMLFDYTPIGRPFAWYILALMLGIYAWRLPDCPRECPQREVARGLLLSAIVLGGSFLVIGVANEFRYHHWSIVAVGCAACLLFSIEAPRRWRTAAMMGVPICALFVFAFVGYMVRHDEWAPIVASSWIDPPTE